jgi:ADP-ribose pyrophosphatase YjhB (NUDIX family)
MNIPKHAKNVFKGIIFDVFQWQQKMFDGTVQTFEVIKRQNTVVIIASYKKKIVLLKQKQPNTNWFYTTPSGRMDIVGEKPKQAALRELREETGMVPKKLLLWKKINKSGKVKSTIYIYIAQNCKIVGKQKLDAGEKITVELISFEDYLKLSDNPISNMPESLIDMYRSRLDKKYKAKYKKAIFGN